LSRRIPAEWNVFAQEKCKWVCKRGEVLDVASVVVCEAKENLGILNTFRNLPGGDSVGFDRIHGYAIWRDNVSKEINFGDIIGALVGVNDKTMLTEVSKHHFNMSVVLARVFGVNQEVEARVDVCFRDAVNEVRDEQGR
jgi:hypothetical protein